MKLMDRPDTRAATVPCERCGARFRAALTRWACPVCGLEVASDAAPGGLAGWLADPANRVVVLVAAATLANALLLAVLAVAVSRAG
jgi:predicted amidophosphoribosyltransferase